MSDPTPAKFRKTKTGKWAVMAPVVSLEKALAENGGLVEVLKKDGGWSTFTVGSLGKPFDVDGEQMCYGYSPEDSDDNAGTPGASSAHGASGATGTSTRPTRQPRSTEWPADADAPNDWMPSPDVLDREPPRDDSEPLPDFQGEPGEEWDGGF
ncbi:MAG: hypothetical protein R2706_06100 [Acidimicrobiales bacterium]